MDILVYYNKKHRSYRWLLSEDVVKSLTVGVDEKKESMNNGNVTVDDILLFLHSYPSLALWMGKALVVASPGRDSEIMARYITQSIASPGICLKTSRVRPVGCSGHSKR